MVRLSVILLAASLLFAACGSRAGVPATGADGQPASAGRSAEWQALILKSGTASYKVTYDVEDSTVGSRSMTLIMAGKRQASVITDASGRLSTYDLGDGFLVTCNAMGEAAPSCLRVRDTTGSEGNTDTVGSAYDALKQAAPVPINARFQDRTILGRAALCASSEVTTAESTPIPNETCIDKETGVALLLKFSMPGANSSMVAREFGRPSEADFRLPAAPTTLEDM